jgi:hypothetical protein
MVRSRESRRLVYAMMLSLVALALYGDGARSGRLRA